MHYHSLHNSAIGVRMIVVVLLIVLLRGFSWFPRSFAWCIPSLHRHSFNGMIFTLVRVTYCLRPPWKGRNCYALQSLSQSEGGKRGYTGGESVRDNNEPLKQRKRRYAVLHTDRGTEPGTRRILHRRKEHLRQFSDNTRCRLAAETSQESQEHLRQLSDNQQCRFAAETAQEREEHLRQHSDNQQCRLAAETAQEGEEHLRLWCDWD